MYITQTFQFHKWNFHRDQIVPNSYWHLLINLSPYNNESNNDMSHKADEHYEIIWLFQQDTKDIYKKNSESNLLYLTYIYIVDYLQHKGCVSELLNYTIHTYSNLTCEWTNSMWEHFHLYADIMLWLFTVHLLTFNLFIAWIRSYSNSEQ